MHDHLTMMRLVRETMRTLRRPRFRLFNSDFVLELLFVLWWLSQGLFARFGGGWREMEADRATPPSDDTVMVPELKEFRGALLAKPLGGWERLAALLHRMRLRFM